MGFVRSGDGTKIYYSSGGDGPPLILVDGALSDRVTGPNGPLALELTDYFTVFIYDRRGRGRSGDRQPYAVEREIEDLAALIDEAGAPVRLYGNSSGAVLALEAAQRGLPIERLALYETPFIVDGSRKPVPVTYKARMGELIAADDRSAAVRMFLRQGVGLPALAIMIMRLLPAWRRLKAAAHTLPYDAALTADLQRGQPLPPSRWQRVTVPTTVVCGPKSPLWMRAAGKSLAKALPDATYRTLGTQKRRAMLEALARHLIQELRS